ncbi:MAG: CaiB/BaiF CoA-transferase family protein [Pseudomonadota bacterium]
MLEGIRVVEHATYMAAPGAGSILADWGAEVIKIEPPGGDPIRKFMATIGSDIEDNPVFDFDNRGKKSVIVNTADADGQAIVRDLAKSADVFLTNVRPGGLERAGLDFASLAQANPKLVYCSLTGYGLTGPDANRPGFDVASFWSRSGLARLTIPKGIDPFPLRTAYGDHTTSMAAAAGICAALVQALKTGKGCLVEASLLRAALFSMGSDFAIQLFFGRIGSTKPRHESIQPLMNFFKTADDAWLCVVPRQGNVDWPPMCRALGLEDLIEDERFSRAKGRRTNARDLVERLDAAFAALTKAEVSERLDAESIAWAPVQTLGEVASDPQVEASGAIQSMPSAARDGSMMQTPGSPIRFPGHDDGPRGPTPLPGEHTRTILESLGRASSDIDALIASGIAATGAGDSGS